MNLSSCDLCSQVIQKGNRIYRAFDNTYCSRHCLNTKCYTIDTIDPEYKFPLKWSHSTPACLIEIPNKIEERKKSVTQKLMNINVSKLSLIQYSYLIATSFGIIGLKTILSYNSITQPFI